MKKSEIKNLIILFIMILNENKALELIETLAIDNEGGKKNEN